MEHALTVDPVTVARIADAGLPLVAQPSFIVAKAHDFEVTPVPAPILMMP